MNAWIPWAVLLGLAAVVARYLRNESTTRRKNEDQHQTTLGEVLEAVTSLRSALVASGAIERLAQLPPPSPKVSPPSKPPGLPRKPVTVTKDDDPVHTRETKVQPAADALVDATKPDEPPSTKPTTSKRRAVPVDAQIERAQERRWTERAEELGPQIEPPPSPALDDTLASASTPDVNDEADEGRVTDEEGTRVFTRVKRPPPHRPPQPITRRPTLFGGFSPKPLPAPVPLNSRTAHRIDVLFWTKLSLAAKSGVVTAHCEGPECDATKATCGCSCSACDRRRTLFERATIEITGPETAAELAARAKVQPPGLAARVERLFVEKVAAVQDAGRNARHCHGTACMEGGEGDALCNCRCEQCTLLLDLLMEATREVAGKDWETP